MSIALRIVPNPAPLRRSKASATSAERGIRLAALRVPLVAKLFGANIVVVAALLGAWVMAGGPFNGAVITVASTVIAFHLLLVMIALRPIRDLENVAARVWAGDYAARVERSSVADHEVLRIGSMFNIMLDDLAADRARMRALAADVIAAGDRERAGIARELHDSTAQRIAAILLQLSTIVRDTRDVAVAERLHETRDALEAVLEEVRVLSHTVHPAVLDDLGLEAALRRLARDSSHGTGIDIDVAVDVQRDRLPVNVEAVLYRIAQEAIRNAVRHAAPRVVRVNMYQSPQAASLEIHDDGRGFDLARADRERSGMGLASMRERLSLVDGWLDVQTAPGNGTTLRATVPLTTE